ncbi:MAG: radical SAM protein [Candidatus Diapherotrites archaeon]
MYALKNYQAILEGKAKPKYLALKDLGKLQSKVEQAYELMASCTLCERKCNAKRMEGKKGYCRVLGPKVNSAFEHFGEEPFFVPSFTVFFSGCNLNCVYCQNFQASQLDQGEESSVEQLAKTFLNANNCRNLNLVGGSPTPQLPFILDALNRIDLNVPVIWNSNFFMSEKAMELLKGTIDVFLSDFKYGSNECALKYSNAPNYLDVVKRNHVLAFNDSEMVVRHLMLPGHFECCTSPVLKFIAEKFKDKAVVNIMDQFHPDYKSYEFFELRRRITAEELSKALKLAEELGLEFIY